MVDAAAVTKPDPINKVGETVLDPHHRTVNQLPVEAAEHAKKPAPSRPDKVDLSPVAKASMLGQEKLQAALQERIAKAFDVEGIDLSGHQGLDYSPDAVSQRVVDFSISLYGVFREQNASLSEEQALNKFESTIRGAVNRGYGDAMKTLSGADMPQSVLDMGQETKSLIDQGFDDFFSRRRSA